MLATSDKLEVLPSDDQRPIVNSICSSRHSLAPVISNAKLMSALLILHFPQAEPLLLARADDGGLLAVLDGTAGGATGLNGPDNLHGLIVSDLAENDVAAVQPGGGDGGDEELGAVAVKYER